MRHLKRQMLWRLGALLLAAILLIGPGGGSAEAQALPKFSIEVGESSSPQDAAVTLEIIFLLTVLALAPAILIMLGAPGFYMFFAGGSMF